jgi:phage repressor protein C with HTH and peptisase S24 domain
MAIIGIAMRGNKKRKQRAANLRLLKKSHTLKSIAEASGTDEVYLSQIANEVIGKGRKSPRGLSDDYAEKIENGLNLKPGWLDEDHSDDKPADYGKQSTLDVVEPKALPVKAWDDIEELDSEHYVFVPRYDVHVSAGNGSMVYEVNKHERPQSFRREYFQQKGLKETNLMCLKASGESMEPTITDGATLLVNKVENTIQDGKVFVIRFGGEIRVKRLYLRPDGGMTVRSDNPSFPDVDITPDQMEHVAILGRVVWQAGEL